MSLKVYVASAWIEQHQRARPMIARLRAIGVEITCDWTQAEGDVCSCGHHRQEHAPYAVATAPEIERATAYGCQTSGCGCTSFNGIGIGGDSKLTNESRRKYAEADLRGVLDADVVVLLAANSQGACGSWVEFGAALTARRLREERIVEGCGPTIDARATPTLVVAGLKNRRTIFTELADHLVDTDDEAFAIVERFSKVPSSHPTFI